MKNILKILLVLICGILYFDAHGVSAGKSFNRANKKIQDTISERNQRHAQKIAKIKLSEKRKLALLYGFAGTILSLTTAGFYFDKELSLSPWVKFSNLLFFGTCSTFFIGKTFNNLFSTIHDNGDGTFQIVSPFTSIKHYYEIG